MWKLIFSCCCSSLLGCLTYVEKWKEDHNYCPKCIAVDFGSHTQSVVGLDEALVALNPIIS